MTTVICSEPVTIDLELSGAVDGPQESVVFRDRRVFAHAERRQRRPTAADPFT